MKNTGSYNSLEARDYMGLIESLVEHDYADLWSSDKERNKDLSSLRGHLLREGLPFLTKRMPSLGKALDKCLATGEPFQLPPGFKPDVKEGCIPKMFREPFRLVLDDSGILLKSAGSRSIAGIRQLTQLFYKLELPYNHEDTQRVLDGFVDTDESLAYLWRVDFSLDPVLRCARGLIGSVMGSIDHRDITPCHGTGAVATGECVLGKSKFSRVYSSAESEYPFTEYFRFSLNHICDTVPEIQELEALPYPTAKVTLVPKDSRGPRIISMEPLEIQWLQQGIMRLIVPHIESHPLTKGQVNFTDQTVNRDLAQSSSVADDWVTLDMKDASDSVSLPLVAYLFGGTRLLAGLLATRSYCTRLPDGREVVLNKFAPMGSALCFPIEALVFWAISVAYLIRAQGYSQLYASKSVYVYGDDLVVSKTHWAAIAEQLRGVSLNINRDKCCVATRFRESCGFDAFDGQEVTPIRIKTRITGNIREWLPSLVAISNSAYARGCSGLANAIECLIDQHSKIECEHMAKFGRGSNRDVRPNREMAARNYKRLRRFFCIPYTDKACGVLTYVRPYASYHYNLQLEPKIHIRWNRKFQYRELRGLQPYASQLDTTYDGWDEMLRNWKSYTEMVQDLLVGIDNPLFKREVTNVHRDTNRFGFGPHWFRPVGETVYRARRRAYVNRHSSKLRLAWTPLLP